MECKTDLSAYIFVLISLFIIQYYFFKQRTNDYDYRKEINDLRYIIQQQQQGRQQQITKEDIQSIFIDKLKNPLSPPENIAIESRRNNYDPFTMYQNIGYLVSENSNPLPVFARYAKPGNTSKFEYYTITGETDNKIKIPFQVKNYNEIYDGDSVIIPDLNKTFVFRKYSTKDYRYTPL